MFNPISDAIEWGKAGINFGYRSIVLGIDLAMIYAAFYACSRLAEGVSCSKHEEKRIEKTSCLEERIMEKDAYMIGNLDYMRF